MVKLCRLALLASAFADALEEDNAMLQIHEHSEVNRSSPFTWEQCKDALTGTYALVRTHIKECVGMGAEEGMYVRVGKRTKGGATRCEDEGLYTIKTATQCAAAIDALKLTADNVEAAKDPAYQPRPDESVVGLKLDSYPNGRTRGCSYNEAFPLWTGYMNGVGGAPSTNNFKTALVHCESDELCGTGSGWDCICASKPVEPEVWCGDHVGMSQVSRDPVELATDEFCAFFCGDGDLGSVTKDCDKVNPVHWSTLKKGNNKAREDLCRDQCAPVPVNGVCVRSQKPKAVLYQDYCTTDAKSRNANSNTQMSRVISDFCTFVCEEIPGGSKGAECKDKNDNVDINAVCGTFCDWKPDYKVDGLNGACSKNGNTKFLCDPEPN